MPERNGQHCRVLARGSMGSIMIEFADGARFVVGWRTIRKLDKRAILPRSVNYFERGEQ